MNFGRSDISEGYGNSSGITLDLNLDYNSVNHRTGVRCIDQLVPMGIFIKDLNVLVELNNN